MPKSEFCKTKNSTIQRLSQMPNHEHLRQPLFAFAKMRKSVQLMYLIHRNRVRKSLQVFAFFFRCGLICLQISSPAGQGLFRLSLSIRASKTDTIIAFTVTVNQTKRMRAESLAPLGKGDRSGEIFRGKSAK